MVIKDIRGQRFNRLVAVKFSHFKEYVRKDRNSLKMVPYWEFMCDCGNMVILSLDSVKAGGTKSCGCWRREASRINNTTHGESHSGTGKGKASRLYGIWLQMKRRCDLPTVAAYPRYGGRGISVCKEWSESFEAFRDWALDNGYSEKLTIDRRDNDGHYEPDNCRWVTHKVQANNRRSNRRLQYSGESYTLAELADKFNVSHSALGFRLLKGMSPEEAIEYLTKQQINEVA